MSIIETTFFKQLTAETFENASPRITIEHSQSNKKIVTTGAVLEEQFIYKDKYILFITEDIPFEEALHILLLNSDLTILDAIELSAPYASGILNNISIQAPNKIQFTFFDNQIYWILKLLEKPKIQLWGNKHLFKRFSPFLHKTWMLLDKK